MEKKRSPRSSSSKSPGTAVFPKSPLVYESYKSGCGWKLINLFDFKHVKSGNKRLSSDKRSIRDSAGNVYTRSQLDLLKTVHEKCQCNDRIVEEEMSCKPKTRRRSFSSEREDDNYESKPSHGLLEREIKRIKNLKDGAASDSLNETEKTNDKDKDKQMELKKKKRDCKKSAEINLQVRVNEAAETLICSKADDKGKDRSKQFMEALDILSSNKELFITLLQDPDSFTSAKKGRDLERSHQVDEIVLLKPRLSSSVDDRVYLRFKHLAKKLKLVVGSNKDDNHAEIKPECSSTSDVSTSIVGHRSPESPVFRRKKRVESDVFKLSIENDVLPRRFVVDRQQERSNSSPVYEVPNALSSLQTKLKERRHKLEKRRESFKLWSLDKNIEVFDKSNLKSPDNNCISSAEYSRTNESDSIKVEQEQPSPVSVLERIHLEDETVSSSNAKSSKLHDPKIDFVDSDSVHEFVKEVLVASRLNWSNLMERCSEETSLLDEFSHGNRSNNKDQLLLVLDYTDEILREVYRQDMPFTKSSSFVNLSSSFIEEDLIQKTMRRFDWCLLCSDSSSPPRTLDQIIESDLKKSWLDLGGESEGLVSDAVEKILQQLVLEFSHELRTMHKGEGNLC